MARLALFLATFAFACVGLTIVFYKPQNLIDEGLWGRQAQWVVEGNPAEFDITKAYGHPGGTLIEATAALHRAGLPYETGLAFFEVIAGALLIAGTVTLTYVLRSNALWSIGALGVLLLDPIYLDSSPPSYLATMLGTYLALYSLWLYEKRDGEPSISALIAWSTLAGALTATRADIGGALVVTFAIVLALRYGVRLTLMLLVLAFAAFCLFDPFMWFMPLEHIRDIFHKMVVHYTGSLITGHDYVSGITSFAARALGAFVLALVLALRKQLPIPKAFFAVLAGATALVCIILFTSGFNAMRYFMPLIFIWELFLPLFLVTALVSTQEPSRAVGPRIMRLLATGAVALVVVAPSTVSLYFFARDDSMPSPRMPVHPVPHESVHPSP